MFCSKDRCRRYTLVGLALCVLALSPPSSHATTDLGPAEQDLLHGRADKASAELGAILRGEPGNGAAHLLLCRVLLSASRPGAADECRLALAHGLSADASAQDWAGRAFGLEAQHAGPLAGLKLAGQVRTAFHTAHQLDARNAAAANDLGEYYVNAPAIVGGGIGKAKDLTDELLNSLPETAHRLRALIADKQGNATVAEQEFRQAVHVAQSPGALVDLTCFYARAHRSEEALATAQRALQQDRFLDANIVDVAGCLADLNQTVPAADALHAYLSRGQQSDAAPAFRAHTMLGNLLVRSGNKAGARKEYEAALALASGYVPARKGLDSL